MAAPIRQFDNSVSDRPVARDLRTLVDLVDLVAGDRLHPVVDIVRSAELAAAAIEDRHRRIRGNLVLTWET